MSNVHEYGSASTPVSAAVQEKVREQLNRMLDTSYFKNSKRYPELLRFIVEEALEGRGEFLKERLLGVSVFDRPADYDTAADPVVRVTIAEIRKRIAQYYHDEEHDAEIRIELLPGHYEPKFRARLSKAEVGTELTSALDLPEHHSTALEHLHIVEAAHPKQHTPHKIWYLVAAAVLVLLALGTFPLMNWLRPTALDVFWAPFIGSHQTILFCIPTRAGTTKGPAKDSDTIDSMSADRKVQGAAPDSATFLDYEAIGENVVYSDMMATLRIANILALHHNEYRVRLNVLTTLDDLRQGPTVLIGGLDNQWTMHALKPLRFHFSGSDESGYWIADTKNPTFKDWLLNLNQNYGAVTRDYAIIARLHNDQTGQPQVIVAGIGMSGTAAAGEFISNEKRVEELQQRVGAGFKDHDFEVVLSTDVVNGIAGSPKILAVTVW
jgi:hypothetical protein